MGAVSAERLLGLGDEAPSSVYCYSKIWCHLFLGRNHIRRGSRHPRAGDERAVRPEVPRAAIPEHHMCECENGLDALLVIIDGILEPSNLCVQSLRIDLPHA